MLDEDAVYDMLYEESSSSESSSNSDENTYSLFDGDILPNDWTSKSKTKKSFYISVWLQCLVFNFTVFTI